MQSVMRTCSEKAVRQCLIQHTLSRVADDTTLSVDRKSREGCTEILSIEAHCNVARAAVALDLFQALDVEGIESPEVSLDGVFLHLVTQLRQLILRQLPRPLVLNALHT